MNREIKWYYLLWLCFIAEAGSLTFFRNAAGGYASPLLFIFAAAAGVYLALKLARNYVSAVAVVPSSEKLTRQSFFLYFLVFGLLVFLIWLWLRSFFDDYPLDPHRSDVIPLIQKMTDRFIHGQPVYKPVTDFGYTIYPTYLPATWLPFVAAEKLQLDYRTWAYILFCGVLFLYLCFVPVKNRTESLLILFPFAVFSLYLWSQPAAFGWTIEPMIAGFYLFLLLGIYLQNLRMMALALLLCLLSRYAIVLWLPVFFILLFIFESKRKALYTAFIFVTGIIIVFVLPFWLSDPGLLQKGFQYYDTGALAEWNGQPWQQPGDLPFQLSQDYGFAIYFYQWGKGDIEQRLKLLQVVHIMICIIIPLLSLVWYWLKGRKWLPVNWFLIFSLKIYLVFFFAFIQVPYPYLFFTPLMVSALIMVLVSIRARFVYKSMNNLAAIKPPITGPTTGIHE